MRGQSEALWLQKSPSMLMRIVSSCRYLSHCMTCYIYIFDVSNKSNQITLTVVKMKGTFTSRTRAILNNFFHPTTLSDPVQNNFTESSQPLLLNRKAYRSHVSVSSLFYLLFLRLGAIETDNSSVSKKCKCVVCRRVATGG